MSIDTQFIDGTVIDVTGRINVYAKGKTFECDCGQGFGVKFEESVVRCPTCGAHCVDHDYNDREAPLVDDGQSTLGGWT